MVGAVGGSSEVPGSKACCAQQNVREVMLNTGIDRQWCFGLPRGRTRVCEWQAVSRLLGTPPRVLQVRLVLSYPCGDLLYTDDVRVRKGESQDAGQGISDELLHEQSSEDNREEGTTSAKALRHKCAAGV